MSESHAELAPALIVGPVVPAVTWVQEIWLALPFVMGEEMLCGGLDKAI